MFFFCLKRFLDDIDKGNVDEEFAGDFLQLYEKFLCALNGYETMSDIAIRGSQIKGGNMYEFKNVEFKSIFTALV